ncbi:MAG: 2-C-methyl-D-erythritol 2,4-cyclodiphosphate synthase [Chlamydiota bacterium]
MKIRTGIGQDSHRFLDADTAKPCVLGGIYFEDVPGLHANSDGDVVLHAICNAITSVSGVKILGGVADELCRKDGITDSAVYVAKAMETLGKQEISHLALTIEGSRPKFQGKVLEMRQNIADLLGVDISQVGITATSGEGLTDFGCGDGLQVFGIITTIEE